MPPNAKQLKTLATKFTGSTTTRKAAIKGADDVAAKAKKADGPQSSWLYRTELGEWKIEQHASHVKFYLTNKPGEIWTAPNRAKAMDRIKEVTAERGAGKKESIGESPIVMTAPGHTIRERSDKEYRCSCGQQFRSWAEAERHADWAHDKHETSMRSSGGKYGQS